MRLEDASILTLNEIGTADCIICGSALKLVKEGDNYSGSHCDREYFVAPTQYKSIVKKVDVKSKPKPEPKVTEVSIDEFSDDEQEFSDEPEKEESKKEVEPEKEDLKKRGTVIDGSVVKSFYVKK